MATDVKGLDAVLNEVSSKVTSKGKGWQFGEMIRHFKVSRPSKEDTRWLDDILDKEGKKVGRRVKSAPISFGIFWP